MLNTIIEWYPQNYRRHELNDTDKHLDANSSKRTALTINDVELIFVLIKYL